MKVLLQDIAEIQTGYFAKPDVKGEVIYLQSRHFDDNGRLLFKPQADLRINGISQKHFLQEGDILFAAKGSKNFASTISNLNAPAVASTTFFVIRLLGSEVLPAFLSWYLNKVDTIDYLQSQAKGSSIPSISKETLQQLRIEIPSINTQDTVIKIVSLYEREIEIQKQLYNLRKYFIQYTLTQSIKNSL